MDKEKVMDKIEKLLRLSKSCNENEAALAAFKAKELMDKYHVSTFELNSDDKSVTTAEEKSTLSKGRWELWERCFLGDLARYFDLFPYFEIFHRKSNFTVIGLKADIEVFEYTQDYLLLTIKRLYMQALKEHKSLYFLRHGTYTMPRAEVGNFRRGFCYGAQKAIIQKLNDIKAEKTTNEICTALVVSKEDAIDAYKNKIGLKTEKNKRKYAGYSIEGYARGLEEGEKINVNPAIKNN